MGVPCVRESTVQVALFVTEQEASCWTSARELRQYIGIRDVSTADAQVMLEGFSPGPPYPGRGYVVGGLHVAKGSGGRPRLPISLRTLSLCLAA